MRIGRLGVRPPLFLRIFGVMLAALIAAQLLDFALLLSVPPPTPRLYPVAEVAQLLHGGAQDTARYRVSVTETTPDDDDDPRTRRSRAQLAERLGVREGDVRLDFDRPPLFLTPGRRPPHWLGDQHEQVLFGHFSAAVRLPDGHWRVVRPASHGIEPWHWRMLLWLFGLLAAVAPFAWWVARRIAQPIGLFAAAAERLGRDPRADPMPVEGPEEVAKAAEAFNQMQARIRRYVDDRVTMAAAMAHDLRTPLMRLSLRVEKAGELRGAMEADIAEMREMIGNALAFVRDIGRPPRRQKLSLRALAESVADEMADLGADVVVELGEDIVIDADVAGLKTLLANLIGNAVAYAGQARVRLAQPDAGHALIEVADDGPGLPDALLERVFEPFFRAEPSRNRETGGSGLGLASARAVARAHGGEITLANRAEGGLLAQVLLPL